MNDIISSVLFFSIGLSGIGFASWLIWLQAKKGRCAGCSGCSHGCSCNRK